MVSPLHLKKRLELLALTLIKFHISGPRSFTGGSGARPPTPSSLRSHKSSTSDKQSSSRPRSNSIQLVEKQAASSRPRSDTQSPKVPPPSSFLPGIMPPTSTSNSTNANPTSSTVDRVSNNTPGASGSAADQSDHPKSSSSFYCFLCGLHSELSFSRMLYSTAPGKKAPYFPFMKKHVPKNRAETLREDGTALVCTFCYHSVMVQWSRYNESRSSMSYVDPSDRSYNIHEYRCYVCGVMTYRKRIRALRAMVSQ